MLVLTRKIGQEILVPQLGMAVTVVAIRDGSVRIGITAPREIQIVRDELVRRKPNSELVDKCVS